MGNVLRCHVQEIRHGTDVHSLRLFLSFFVQHSKVSKQDCPIFPRDCRVVLRTSREGWGVRQMLAFVRTLKCLEKKDI